MLLLGLMALTTGACGEPEPDGASTVRDGIQPPVMLSAEPLTSSDTIGRVRRLLVVGQTVWVADKAGDPYLHEFRLTDGAHLASHGQSGAGPGDFRSAGNLSLRDNAVWVFDLSLRRVTEVGTTDRAESVRMIAAPDGVRPMDMFWLTPATLVMIGPTDSSRFMFADELGNIRRTHASALLGADSIPLSARMALSTGFVACASPEQRRFVIGYVGAGKIEIVTDSGAVILAQVPTPSNGEFSLREDGSWKPETYFRHYESCALTPRRIYMLYAGKQTLTPEERATVSAHEVQAYDWSGTLLGRWNLETALSTIAVSGDTLLIGADATTGDLVRVRLPGGI